MPARRRTVVASQPASPNPQPAPARTRRPTRRSRSAALRLSLLAWALCVAVLHLYGSTSIRIRLDATLADASSILLVVAHPDDETLFFSPTIVGLRDGGRRSIGVLVLSNGDHEGVGGVREREMQLACVALGLSPCAVLDDPDLQDGPKHDWPASKIQHHVCAAVKDVHAIVTFNEHGVTGHANHRAISRALGSIAPSLPPLYTLRSLNVVQHYLGPLQSLLALSSSRASARFIVDRPAYRSARTAFRAHASQQRWYRSLNVLASSFMYSNQLDRYVHVVARS